MLNIDTDIAGLERDLAGYRQALKGELVDVGREVAEEGQALVRQALDVLVYATPQRGSYVRSRKLRGSVYGFAEAEANGFSVVLGAVGGAGGRAYGEFVDRGTFSSRIDRDRLLADARGDSGFNPRGYERGTSGLEARAFMEASIAEVERQAEERLFEAQDKAWG